jgi:hypothetical protein
VAEVPMGTTLGEVIERIGWGMPAGRRIGTILAGTANALIPEGLLDTPLSFEAMRAAGTGLGSAGFVVFDERTDPVAVAAGVARFLGVESCGQCEPCKRDGTALAALLDQLRLSDLDERGFAELRSRLDTVDVGARCNLASQQSAVVGSLLRLYGPQVEAHLVAAGTASPPAAPEPALVVPIDNIIGGRVILDAGQLAKQPDWSYDAVDSGAAPAARLGNTPVSIDLPSSGRRWPEWEAQFSDEHPLEVIDASHEELDHLVRMALESGPEERLSGMERLEHALRLHVDVTRRILTFMGRRHGGERGEELADVIELRGVHLLELLDEIDAEDADDERWRSSVTELGSQLPEFAGMEDELLELLRTTMDPQERAELGNALAEGIVTSNVP